MADYNSLFKVRTSTGYDQYLLQPSKATSTKIGGVMPVDKTTAMTQDVGMDSNGRLYTAPSSSSSGGNTLLYSGETYSSYYSRGDYCSGFSDGYACFTSNIVFSSSTKIKRYRITWSTENRYSNYGWKNYLILRHNSGGYIELGVGSGSDTQFFTGDIFITIIKGYYGWEVIASATAVTDISYYYSYSRLTTTPMAYTKIDYTPSTIAFGVRSDDNSNFSYSTYIELQQL